MAEEPHTAANGVALVGYNLKSNHPSGSLDGK